MSSRGKIVVGTMHHAKAVPEYADILNGLQNHIDTCIAAREKATEAGDLNRANMAQARIAAYRNAQKVVRRVSRQYRGPK